MNITLNTNIVFNTIRKYTSGEKTLWVCVCVCVRKTERERERKRERERGVRELDGV